MPIKKNDKKLKTLKCVQDFKIKAVESENDDVIIEGFANRATIDRGDEFISPKAWKLENFKINPIILFNHGFDVLGGTPVGKAVDVEPTEEGLKIKVKMSNSKAPLITMIRDLVREKILKTFSVGFDPIEEENVDMEGRKVLKITQAELLETSIVGIPMNQDSTFDISAKALKTKSFHEIKEKILETKSKDSKAHWIEKHFHPSFDRSAIIKSIAYVTGNNVNAVLDMLAGNIEMDEVVYRSFREQLKFKDRKQLDDKKEDDESKEEGKSEKATDEQGKESIEDESGIPKEDEKKPDEKPKDVKAEFQDCVNSKVPKLIEDGMAQDEAIALAISQCQESNKCKLATDSKAEIFNDCFTSIDSGKSIDVKLELIKFEGETEETKATKQAGEEGQLPTTEVQTEDLDSDFGNPFLDAQKQTNIFLASLVQEIQKLNIVMTSVQEKNAVELDKDTGEIESEGNSIDISSVDKADKRLKALKEKLKNLGV